MLNTIWPVFIILSIIYSFFSGNLKELSNSFLQSADTAVNLCINLLGAMVLWNGIIQIASKTKVIGKISIILNPIINYLFPNIDKKGKLYKEISMNLVANILGLGNAATPLRN